MNHNKQDRKFIQQCVNLSQQALDKGDAPFGALVVKDGEVIAEGINDSHSRTSDHAEVIALHKAHQTLGNQDLSGCTLYSNCEPCPMCSFMCREYKVDRVVFALPSPFVGGYSKRPILQDTEMEQFAPFFKKAPEVISGILEDKAKKVFDQTPLWMFGSDARDHKNCPKP